MQSFTGSVRNGSIQHYGTAAGSDFRSEQPPESEMSTEPTGDTKFSKEFATNYFLCENLWIPCG